MGLTYQPYVKPFGVYDRRRQSSQSWLKLQSRCEACRAAVLGGDAPRNILSKSTFRQYLEQTFDIIRNSGVHRPEGFFSAVMGVERQPSGRFFLLPIKSIKFKIHLSTLLTACGLIFAYQENDDHYGVFLDRSLIRSVDMDRSYGRYRRMGTTRGL
jgi:hypothetical protein